MIPTYCNTTALQDELPITLVGLARAADTAPLR